MQRPKLDHAFLAAALVVFLAMAPATPAAEKTKLLYHVSFEEKLPFAFDDIEERVKRAGGAQNLDIVLVVDGPALKALLKDSATKETKTELVKLQKLGVRSEVCGDSMKFFKINSTDMLPGFIRLEQGSIVRIDALKAEGYEYLRF